MRHKLKSGVEIELTDADIREIVNMYGPKPGKESFNFSKMNEYFEEMKTHAIQKMEHISDHVIGDEEGIDIAAEFVAKNGTYHDFIKFLRYEMDYNLAYHILESTK